MTIAERVADVERRISAACARAGRSRAEVTLVAIAKGFPPDTVSAALDAGVSDIGVNRAQEFKEKVAVIGDRARWHFVGHLQTNKVRQVVGTVALIHSVDRYGLAEAIARRARSLGTAQDVLVEVNLAGEASKAGIEPPNAVAFALEIATIEGVDVRGFMAIPPLTDDDGSTRSYFAQLRAVRDEFVTRASGRPIAELSMGMSKDFEVAIEEGATLVRVGTAIFGPRSR